MDGRFVSVPDGIVVGLESLSADFFGSIGIVGSFIDGLLDETTDRVELSSKVVEIASEVWETNCESVVQNVLPKEHDAPGIDKLEPGHQESFEGRNVLGNSHNKCEKKNESHLSVFLLKL